MITTEIRQLFEIQNNSIKGMLEIIKAQGREIEKLKNFISVNNSVSGNEATPKNNESGEVAVCEHPEDSQRMFRDNIIGCLQCGKIVKQTDR